MPEEKFEFVVRPNYFAQMQQAAQMATMFHEKLLREGYIEVAPGVLRHPQTGVEVFNG